MDLHTHLLIHNIVCIISIIATFGMALFTYLNAPRKIENITWALMMLGLIVFYISHIVGVNLQNSSVSKTVLMLNLSVFFVVIFNLHAIIALIGKTREKRGILIFMYTSVTLFILLFLITPELFLATSVPKMYFPNYYVPGVFHWVKLVLIYGIIFPYMMHLLYVARRTSTNVTEKTQLLYFFWTMWIGYSFSILPNLLIFDIPHDPIWGIAFSVIFMPLFIYSSVKYGLFNVKVIAKQAFYFSIIVALVGGFIVLFNFSNQWLLRTFPGFPIWLTPLISSVIVVALGIMVWKNARQGDILKYEFITTVTHKFRTPLTHIKWASENLIAGHINADDRMQVEYIQNANSKLVELTNLLVNVSEAENNVYDYKMEKGNVSELITYVTDSLSSQFFSKHIQLTKRIEPGMQTSFDDHRIRFVVQTFVENALNYTPSGGTLNVTAKTDGSFITCSVTDNGMGIPANELPLLFSKFYRGKAARIADTEGMGIGLFMSKDVINRHGGKIWAESPGSNKGSTFAFSLPIIH